MFNCAVKRMSSSDLGAHISRRQKYLLAPEQGETTAFWEWEIFSNSDHLTLKIEKSEWPHALPRPRCIVSPLVFLTAAAPPSLPARKTCWATSLRLPILFTAASSLSRCPRGGRHIIVFPSQPLSLFLATTVAVATPPGLAPSRPFTAPTKRLAPIDLHCIH